MINLDSYSTPCYTTNIIHRGCRVCGVHLGDVAYNEMMAINKTTKQGVRCDVLCAWEVHYNINHPFEMSIIQHRD